MTAVISPPEQRIVLRGVAWETYEQLLSNFKDASNPRFTFDRRVLEIMILSAKHELPNRLIALLVEVVAEEMNTDIVDLGSTTFRREDLARGFEPDSCFYIQNAARIRGKDDIDLAVDPPPDMVIEVDISASSLDRFAIYSAVGVPEIWRYDGKALTISCLIDGEYVQRDASVVLPPIRSAAVSEFLKKAESMSRPAWLRKVREWVREQTVS